VLDKAK